MGKPELGTKRMCPSCGTKYYDLNRDPIVCSKCGTIFAIAAQQRAPERAVAPPAAKQPVVESVVEREENVVSLEEAEEDVAGDLDPAVEDEEAADVPDTEGDEDIESTEDDTFLEGEEEEGDDVTGLLDVEAEDEEER